MQLKAATAFIGLAIAASSARADVGWSLDAGLLRTDNAALTNTAKIKDTLTSVGGAVAWELESSRTKISLNGAGSQLHYLNDTFDDDLVGRADLSAVFQLVPERISWTIQDSYGQVAANPFAPATPTNRQDVNFLTTGPDFRLRLGSRTSLQIAGRYGDTRYQGAGNIDTSNWGGSAGLVRELSSATSLGIYGSQTRHSYDDPLTPQYDQRAGWISLQSRNARQSLSADIGFDRVSGAGFSGNNPLLRLLWDRRIYPSWRMRLRLNSEYQNTGQQFAQNYAPVVGIETQPAKTRLGDLSFIFERSRTAVGIGGGWRKADYKGAAALDEDGWFAHADLSHRFSPSLQVFVRSQLDHRSYRAGLDQNIRRWTGETGLDWRLGRSLFLTLGYSHSGSDGDTTVNRYSQNLFSGRLSWRGGSTVIAPRTFGY